MNIKDAEFLAREYNRDAISMDIGFCPLIKETCNMKCVCYKAASVHPTGSHEGQMQYVAIKPHCGNAMFFGGG